MTKWIGAILLAAALLFVGAAQLSPAAAANAGVQKVEGVNTTDVSARRHERGYGYASRPLYPYPYYYGRPVYYAPAPFLPIPPFFGYGWEWW
jgi:hypothetical protein